MRTLLRASEGDVYRQENTIQLNRRSHLATAEKVDDKLQVVPPLLKKCDGNELSQMHSSEGSGGASLEGGREMFLFTS